MYAFWVKIFEAQLIDKKISYLIVTLLCTSHYNPAPFPRTRGTAETLIYWPAANPTYNSHMQGQLTDKTTDVYTAICCFTLH